MNFCHLFWIVPLVFALGWYACALVAANRERR